MGHLLGLEQCNLTLEATYGHEDIGNLSLLGEEGSIGSKVALKEGSIGSKSALA